MYQVPAIKSNLFLRSKAWELATSAQLYIPHVKSSIVSFWDKILFRIEPLEDHEARKGKIQASSAKRQLRGAPEDIGSR